MEFKEFKEMFSKELKQMQIELLDEQYKKFFDYMNLLIEWNEKINLTTIIEPKEVVTKHFIDSLTITPFINKNERIIDVGTGAGFPGIPIKILYPDSEVVLLDSLNKRLNFLNEVISRLQLKKIETLHLRAEEAGIDERHRETYDTVVSRAVAPLNILLEYTVPLAKKNGKCIYMKSNKLDSEIENAKNAIKELNVIVEKKEELKLPFTEIERTILLMRKKKETIKKYPRKAGTPSKLPL